MSILGEESHVYQYTDELWKALVAEGAADYGAGFGDGVFFCEGGGVTVWVGDEGKACVACGVRFGGGHEAFAVDLAGLAIFEEPSCVAQR